MQDQLGTVNRSQARRKRWFAHYPQSIAISALVTVIVLVPRAISSQLPVPARVFRSGLRLITNLIEKAGGVMSGSVSEIEFCTLYVVAERLIFGLHIAVHARKKSFLRHTDLSVTDLSCHRLPICHHRSVTRPCPRKPKQTIMKVIAVFRAIKSLHGVRTVGCVAGAGYSSRRRSLRCPRRTATRCSGSRRSVACC
jgi:hypothetical protein